MSWDRQFPHLLMPGQVLAAQAQILVGHLGQHGKEMTGELEEGLTSGGEFFGIIALLIQRCSHPPRYHHSLSFVFYLASAHQIPSPHLVSSPRSQSYRCSCYPPSRHWNNCPVHRVAEQASEQ